MFPADSSQSLRDLPSRWRNRAASLRRNAAAEQPARAFERAAEELEETLSESMMAPLTLEEAEIESGYSRSHLRRLIREKVLPNSGSDLKPLILRRHLPRKPGHGVSRTSDRNPYSRLQVARAVLGKE